MQGRSANTNCKIWHSFTNNCNPSSFHFLFLPVVFFLNTAQCIVSWYNEYPASMEPHLAALIASVFCGRKEKHQWHSGQTSCKHWQSHKQQWILYFCQLIFMFISWKNDRVRMEDSLSLIPVLVFFYLIILLYILQSPRLDLN